MNVANSLEQLLAGRFNEQNNTGWDLADMGADAKDPKASKQYILPEPLQPNDYLKATICWYRHYQQDRLFRVLPLRTFYLELWRMDNEGKRIALLDQSYSRMDNLQHIYYRSDRKQSVALVIRTANEPEPGDPERVALAFSVTDDNWAGDLMAEDMNVDGVIDLDDAQLLLTQIKEAAQKDALSPSENETQQSGDLNHDGKIDTDDFLAMIQAWNQKSVWHEGH